MKLSDADLQKLIPLFMRKDDTAIGLSKGVNEFTHIMSRLSPLMRKWDQIDSMSEGLLDELAWELNIDWYDSTVSVDIKRQIIKDSDMVHAHRGTKWAVERLASTYFGEARVEEWFEYGGNPYYFRIRSSNPLATPEDARKFRAAINSVKNVRSWLEDILILRTWDDVLERDFFTWQNVLGLKLWQDAEILLWDSLQNQTWGQLLGNNTWGNVYSFIWEG